MIRGVRVASHGVTRLARRGMPRSYLHHGVPTMLTIYGRPQKKSSFCDGVSRRDFLRIGGMVMGGLTLPQLLAAESYAGLGKSHKAIINVFLPGGPPHQDMWEIKVDAPSEIRGEFQPIKTNVQGIEICEMFPKIAA